MAEDKCYVCNEKLSAWGHPGANKCRTCGHNVCNKHFKDGLCSFCREKMGKK
jgi:hypothetical protein